MNAVFSEETIIEITSSPEKAQADHSVCSWLIIVCQKRTESTRVMNKALKIAHLNYISV